MKTRILVPVVILAAIAVLILGYVQMSKEQAADKEADQPITAASRVLTGTNGETVITLDTRTQQLIGLQTAMLPAATLPPEVKAYGRVLDSAALVSLHNDVVTAEAALQASKPEYERLKKLSAQDNASVHALETAEAQMKHDRGALVTAEAQIAAASTTAVLKASADFFQSLAEQKSVLVRLDVPVGESVAAAPMSAQLQLPGAGQSVAADFVGHAATTDPQEQGVGYILLVTNTPSALTPGLAVTGFLQLPGETLHGVVVPDDAVVRSDERAWFYVQTGDTNFSRREITLNQPAPGGWFMTNNVAPGDRVVTVGAQTLLSEERKSQIKLED
ncbi:MAG TPA: hypothetical protein VFY06_09270 [Verrucomicrobiae bacterium]|nr:hypothetical protein [Verrucomicrobiae bacterium]